MQKSNNLPRNLISKSAPQLRLIKTLHKLAKISLWGNTHKSRFQLRQSPYLNKLLSQQLGSQRPTRLYTVSPTKSGSKPNCKLTRLSFNMVKSKI